MDARKHNCFLVHPKEILAHYSRSAQQCCAHLLLPEHDREAEVSKQQGKIK